MKVFVTGGTGFTGKRLLPLLKGSGQVRCLVRDSKQVGLVEQLGFEAYVGDVRDLEGLQKGMQGCQGLINIVSLGFGDASHIVTAAEKAGVQRAVFISTTAIETQLNAPSKKVRLQGEKIVKESKLKWTLLRPTMIYGAIDDRNIARLIRWLKKLPVLLLPGQGQGLHQPIFVEDLAQGIKQAFHSSKTISKTYNLSGKEPLSFRELILTTGGHLGKKVFLIPIPFQPLIWSLKIIEKVWSRPFIKSEQILRLMENKNFSHEDASQDFDFSPRSFSEGVRLEIEGMEAK